MLTVIGKVSDLSRIGSALVGRHGGTGRAGPRVGLSALNSHCSTDPAGG